MAKNNKLSRLFNVTFIVFLSIQVASCGGGGDDVDSSSNTPTPTSLYNGNLNPAVLDESNANNFARLLFGNAVNSTPLTKSRPTTNSSSILTNQSVLISDLMQSIDEHASTALQQKSILTTEHCWLGGTLHKEGEQNDDETGTIHLTYTDCEDVAGIILSGKASISKKSTEYPRLTITTLSDLNIEQEQADFTLNGSIEQLINTDDERDKYQWLEKRNILSTHTETNSSTLFANVELEINGSTVENTETGRISGKVYLQGDGYVSLSNDDNFVPNFSRNDLYPQTGTSYFTGASNSKAKVTHVLESYDYIDGLNQSSEYRLDLDKDGDNIFELTSIQLYDDSIPTSDFAINQQPVSAINLHDQSYVYSGCRNVEDDRVRTGYKRNKTVYMFSECSTDLENDELTVQWTLESKPEGSLAELNEPTDSSVNSIDIDLIGIYTISLKVTDNEGSAKSATSFIDITSPNYTPYIYFDEDTYIGFVGKEFTIDVISSDDVLSNEALDFEYIITSYEWLLKPSGSTAELEIASTSYIHDDETISTWRRDSYKIVADKVGNYIANFHATDREGNTFSTGYEFKIVE